MSGTAHIKVGRNKLASPFTPDFTFVLLFVNVLGELKNIKRMIKFTYGFSPNSKMLYSHVLDFLPIPYFNSIKKATGFS